MTVTTNRRYASTALWAGAALALAVAPSAHAQKTQTLQLKPGNSTTATGTIQGDAYVDYLVSASAGQSLTVTMKPDSAYFNVLSPINKLALFNGSMQPAMKNRTLPDDGKYVIRVYQMGNAKSSKKAKSYTLTVRLGGKAIRPIPGSQDVRIAGTRYHAQAEVPCKLDLSPGSKSCEAFVIRREGGVATVHFRTGSGFRSVLVEGGRVLGTDSTDPVSVRRSGDQTTIAFGNPSSETYTIVDALVVGG